MVYRGETHAGEHEPIVDRVIFDAVQAKLAEQVRARRVRMNGSPAILTGRIFDDRGNRMTPSHSNKDGVRYRYYVSHALLQRCKEEAGAVARVAAAPLERLVVEAVRARTQLSPELTADLSEREVVERLVARVVVCPNAVDMELREEFQALAAAEEVPSQVADVRDRAEQAASSASGTVIRLPWSAPAFPSVKGVLHQPDAKPTLKPGTRDALLLAISGNDEFTDRVDCRHRMAECQSPELFTPAFKEKDHSR